MNAICEFSASDTLESIDEPSSPPAMREISKRVSCGVEITLYWHFLADALSVMLRNLSTGATLELSADPAEARDAFEHPYPFAARHRVDYRDILQV